MEEKDDMTLDVFYERLECAYESYPLHDVRTVLGDDPLDG